MKGTDSSETLSSAFRRISEEGKGAIIYISRSNSGLDRLGRFGKSKSIKPGDMGLREYGIGAQILVALGLKRIRLLSHKSRNVVALDGYGLEIVEQQAL